jgi:hypothetical protein
MQFVVQKNTNKTWSIIPASGVYEGVVVAEAEGVNMGRSRFFGEGKVVGSLKALWGVTILHDIYGDMNTLRHLGLGKSFNTDTDEEVVLDCDGLRDRFSHRLLKGAKRVLLMGHSVYTKGQF